MSHPQALRPPTELSAAQVFDAWLPTAWQDAGARAPFDTPRVRVSVSGDGGGDWLVRASARDLAIERFGGDAPASNDGAPDIWIRLAAADFRASFAPDPDLPLMFPARFGVLDLLFLDPRDADMARSIAGRFRLEVLGRRRRRWVLDAAFGAAGISAGRARTTVQIEGAAYEAISNGSKPPLQALLEGRIKIEGDRALAMQLFALMAARLAR